MGACAEPEPRHARRLQKYLGPRRHSPKKRAPQALSDKPSTPPKRVKAWRDGTLKLENAGFGTPNMNAGLPEFMSNGLDRLPAEPGHIRPDPCTNQRDRPRCVPTQRCEEISPGVNRVSIYEGGRIYYRVDRSP